MDQNRNGHVQPPGLAKPAGCRRLLVFDYYDGATDGVLEADTGDVYRFDLQGEEHNPDGLDRRTYYLRPLSPDALDRLTIDRVRPARAGEGSTSDGQARPDCAPRLAGRTDTRRRYQPPGRRLWHRRSSRTQVGDDNLRVWRGRAVGRGRFDFGP